MADLSFQERVSQHRRCSLLRVLAEAPGYEANESLLHEIIEGFGLGCSRDQVRSELSWLAEQGLVTLQETAGIFIGRITGRGEDVASGRVTVPGVKRPSPR